MQLGLEPLHQFQPNLAQSIWVKGIQVFRNEEPRPFPRGNNIEKKMGDLIEPGTHRSTNIKVKIETL